MEDKWYYPIQEKVKEYLKENYTDWVYVHQDICDNRYYEMIKVYKDNGEIEQLLILGYKLTQDFSIWK